MLEFANFGMSESKKFLLLQLTSHFRTLLTLTKLFLTLFHPEPDISKGHKRIQTFKLHRCPFLGQLIDNEVLMKMNASFNPPQPILTKCVFGGLSVRRIETFFSVTFRIILTSIQRFIGVITTIHTLK